MSYRCDICGTKVPPGQHRLTHVVYKPLGPIRQIHRELACCEGCHMMLDELPLSAVKDPYYLRPKRGKTTVEVPRTPAPAALLPESIEFDIVD